jgi:hypothetical protein
MLAAGMEESPAGGVCGHERGGDCIPEVRDKLG